MNIFTRLAGCLLVSLLTLSGPSAFGQSILNPNDSVVTYNPLNPPAVPTYGAIAKWVRTVRMTWNTNLWKCYIYNGNQFRLRFPKSYNPTVMDGKLYPLIIFMHGGGDGGPVYDNEESLYYGGQFFDTCVSNGTFDGYVLYMQTSFGWGITQMTAFQYIIDYMIQNNKLDPFRVITSGISAGGSGAWQMYQDAPTYSAAVMPMSSVDIAFDSPDTVARWKYEPIWNIHGGLDGSPAPYTAQQVANAMAAGGANYTDLDMTTQGHVLCDSAWSMATFWPWNLRQYSSDPWTLFGRTQFCPGDSINLTVGLQAGFQAYQWRKNGVVIPGATSNAISVTSLGTYDARVERNGIWSNWSPTPVVISYAVPTAAPAITVSGLMSKVIPAPDGNTGVTLAEPTGYGGYIWQKVDSTGTIGTDNTIYANSPGQYVCQVTQPYGCSSSFSAPFTVAGANGPDKPDAASGLVVTAVSPTSLKLTWSQDPKPVYNETNFEIYQGTHTGGPYKLVAITGADVSTDTITGLATGTKYYYIIRAVDSTAASANSNEASASTSADTQPPTSPGNLSIAGNTKSSITLSWTAATDNVGVTAYYVYINGARSYVVNSPQTSFTVADLNFQQSYAFYITAVDAAGNNSPASNQVSGEPLPGLGYQYFTFSTVGPLPNYSALKPVSSGTVDTVTLSPTTQDTTFGFLFQGYLRVTTPGTYSFQTTSDDGSALYLGTLNSMAGAYVFGSTPLVNNDGSHGAQTVTSANVALSAGLYPIAIAYYQGGGSYSLSATWKTPGAAGFVTIPAGAFVDSPVINGNAPAAPFNLVATSQSYNKIGLTWKDSSNNVTGFEIWRSTSPTSGYVTVGSVGAGGTSYTDSTLAGGTPYYYEVRADNLYGQSLFTNLAQATTQPLPAVSAAPTALTTRAVSASSITLSWTNNAANATSIQVYRSANTDQQYVPWATLPVTASSYTDSGLFANALYYYKLDAVNAGGSSVFSVESSATTLDNLPVITKLPANAQARYGTTTVFNVTATSANSGGLTFAAGNLPSFAGFVDNGNGTSVLTVTPAVANVGTYPGVFIVVADAYGGTDTTKFNLAVNNNYAPVLTPVNNITMNEGDTLTIPLMGSNQNPADTLSFAVSGAPGRSVLTPVSNGVATLFLQPSYAAAGTYTIQVMLNDKNGLSAMQSFAVTVNQKSPLTKIFTRVVYNDASALGLPWNGLLGTSTSNLVDSNGNATGLGLNFSPSSWWTPTNGGSSTGNNSGVYPDEVLLNYMWFGSIYGGPNTFNGTVTGGDTSSLYDLTFFANSTYSGMQDNGWTTYTAGGQTVSLHVQNNKYNTVTISSLKPAADGTLPFVMGLGQNNTQLGYFSALVITKRFDDGSVPAGISGLTATDAPGQVQLNWTDSAYNATGYQVWRSLTGTGNYSMLGTVTGNSANSYLDSTVSGSTGYTYEVQAVNTHGNSAFDSVSTVTLHRVPKITAIQNIIMKDTSSLTVNVTTTDDSTTQLTLTAVNLPPSASFTDNGNGTGVLTIAPSAGTVGIYSNVSITVADQYDSTASTSFSIAVTEPDVQSVYLSFTGGAAPPAPWNTMTTPPYQGTVLSNLTDDSGTPTGISATLIDGWYWSGSTGYVTGNSDGVYPPSVIQNFIYDPATTKHRIQISGLSSARQYNFVFFNSQWDGTNGLTTFNINGDSVQLQPDWNINKTVQLNGITPVNGVVTIQVSEASGALNAYLNSIVIQGYDTAAGMLLSPADLRVLSKTQTTVNLQWQDRSAIETGYEVWKASDSTGSYSLLASLPANATTYQDTHLGRGANYYYIVRAVSNGNYSNYSNVLAVTTYSDAIYIHASYTSAGNGPTPPWNNLNSQAYAGTSWSNFIDSTGAITSVGMVQTGEFAGANALGDVTGNNSGVYPDPVLLQQYVLFPGDYGTFTVSGLNLSKVYDFTFFGSENYEGGNNNTGYIVNGDTVYLNALDNTNATVTLHGVVPNGMGQANIEMYCTSGSYAGWFNAMVIDGYTPLLQNAPAVPQTPGATGGSNSKVNTASGNQFGAAQSASALSMDSVIQAYPNPFHTSFTLSVPVFSSDEKVMVVLFDANGRLVYRKEFDNVLEGVNYLQIGDDANIGVSGVYPGKVIFSSGRAAQSFKVVKD